MVNLAFDLGGWRQLDPQRSNGAVAPCLAAGSFRGGSGTDNFGRRSSAWN
jgi:hypothetical protein